MSTALEDVATAADQIADDGRAVARQAHVMQRRRDRGWSWSQVLDDESPPGIVGTVRRLVQHAAQAAATLATAIARGLTEEGESRRRVAKRLGVTHQRVSAILRNGDARSAGSGSG